MIRLLAVSLCALSAAAAGAQGTTARAPVTDTDVFLATLRRTGNGLQVGPVRNLTSRPGYDNQPAFSADGRTVYYTRMAPNAHKRDSVRDVQTDIWRIDLRRFRASAVTDTYESEYSAAETPDGRAVTVIRVERDSAQHLWRMPLAGGDPAARLVGVVKPVGYYAWSGTSVAMFVLGAPATLQLADTARGTLDTIARDIGRGVKRVVGTARISFVQKAGADWYIDELDPATRRVTRLIATLPRVEDYAWLDSLTIIAGKDDRLYSWTRGTAEWRPLPILTGARVVGIGRVAVDGRGRQIAFTATPAPTP
jgi:hypothetical protein